MNNRFIPFVILLCLGASTILTGCGFRLQGQYTPRKPSPSPVHVQLVHNIPYGSFHRTFYALSKQYAISIIPPHTQAFAIPKDTHRLRLSEPQWDERSLSYSSDAQTNYVLLELTLPYEVQDLNGNVIATQSIVLARPMSIAPNAFLNNDNQRVLVKEALIQKACTQLLHRLASRALTS